MGASVVIPIFEEKQKTPADSEVLLLLKSGDSGICGPFKAQFYSGGVFCFFTKVYIEGKKWPNQLYHKIVF